MTISADLLAELADIEMPAESFRKVLKILAKVQAKEEARKADQRERTRKSREKKRDGDVTVTLQERDGNKQGVLHSPNSLCSTLKTKNPPSPPTGAQTPTGVCRRQGTALPLDWKPKERHFAKAAEKCLDRDWTLGEAEAMREWAEGNSNRQIARKANWDRTFDSWLRKAIPKAVKAFNGTGPPRNGAYSEDAMAAALAEAERRQAAKRMRSH